MENKRLTAIKVSTRDMVEGAFHPAEGFDSAYVITNGGNKVSRVRILGTVMSKFVSEDGGYGFIVIDDQSETLRAKIFKNVKMIEGIEVGDVVDVFGKVREYNGERYVSPEIIRKIENPNFLILRMAELALAADESKKVKEKISVLKSQASDLEEVKKLAKAEGIDEQVVETVAQSERGSDKKAAEKQVLDLIEALDEGTGAEYSKLMEKSGMEEAVLDDIINDLLSEGTCYEPRPGRIKKL